MAENVLLGQHCMELSRPHVNLVRAYALSAVSCTQDKQNNTRIYRTVNFFFIISLKQTHKFGESMLHVVRTFLVQCFLTRGISSENGKNEKGKGGWKPPAQTIFFIFQRTVVAATLYNRQQQPKLNTNMVRTHSLIEGKSIHSQ